ncbi:hypothetical protein [Phenylobacterium sp.]|uniref:hypothetical protein n=1 Tax=Phenylobacterium sp. TaxID=1871053 RepID=UPI002DEEB544|nr:hypothetical protein [Phenylobacterium sp.]
MRATLIMTAMFTAAVAVHARAAEPAAQVRPNSYGHHLIETELARHPNVVVMAMHATPPGSKTNVIVASNIGRLGKAADADDLQVTTSGQAKLSVNAAGDHFEALEPLKDLDGQVIGALGVVFRYKAGDDKAKDVAEAEAIRDRLSHKISHAGNLLDPWPYDPKFTARTYAQVLVDQTMATHPEIRILAIHATPPGGKTNVILGSNIGRIGKAADEDDLRVIEKGETNREVNDTGRRFEAELPLNDSKGHRIGALGVVLGYHAGQDKEALVRHAEKIRDELAAKIASPAALARKAG